MKPYNAMRTKELNLPEVGKEVGHEVILLPSASALPVKMNNEMVIKRSILNVVTTKNLRAVHIFTFNDNKTVWNRFEPSANPMNENEFKGLMIQAMKHIRIDPSATLKNVNIKSNSFIKDTKPIVDFLHNIERHELVVVVMLFKNALFVSGNAYDESSFIHAILNFKPIEKTQRNSYVSNLGQLEGVTKYTTKSISI